jgi:hypothetical protein
MYFLNVGRRDRPLILKTMQGSYPDPVLTHSGGV